MNKWKLNNTILIINRLLKKSKAKTKTSLEINDNENMTTQNLWDTAKAVLIGKFTTMQFHLRKQKHIEETT